MSTQRRGRSIAMEDHERDAFLADQRVCRVATNGPSGPHATPLWFVWDNECLWLYSLTRSQRWADISRQPRIAVVVDTGHDYLELRGVELVGEAEVVGEVPRTGQPEPALETPESLFATKYVGLDTLPYDERHAWLRIRPETIRSWDFRKLGG
ncbi:pyridoxamine 5'-phosphate oxidase family protein [Nocardia brasiliensis]|uniref:pyridoxamine 5'-phosphate oxidase family protein n=1 Tax=Nocardia brasiliensis TaxID=37326 RepID=UPI0004A76BC3|nr:pyridoxamine 5'-phosphate oxidase family protein [Nocardia brasiliensis]